MGVTQAARYTRMMRGQGPSVYQCAALRVSPDLGVVSNDRGESIRLGPVNMRVLATLLSQPGRMISRSELFDGVWPNQIVSDDALTRCVSDIRGQLRKLSGRDDWIETLPKRGYRWIGPVSEAGPDELKAGLDDLASPPSSPTTTVPKPAHHRHPVLWLAGRGLAYLLAFVVLASLAVLAVDRFSGPHAPVVAVLPVTADPARAKVAAEFDRGLRTWLGEEGSIRVLARSAIDARPENPFPFFAYEFGARWLVEASLQEAVGQTIILVAVADARTGIVEMQYSERVTAGAPDELAPSEQVRKALDDFFESQLGGQMSDR